MEAPERANKEFIQSRYRDIHSKRKHNVDCVFSCPALMKSMIKIMYQEDLRSYIDINVVECLNIWTARFLSTCICVLYEVDEDINIFTS